MENILKNRKSEPRTRVASLEEKLRSQVRVLDGDKKILAENLGRICAELNPDKPLTAVSLLIEKSGLQSLQQKRKRFIRLPGEEESSVGEKGAYGASGETFATLGSTAAAILAASNNEGVQKETKDALFRRLLRNTSLLPTFQPQSLGERKAKSLLDEYAERLSEKIAKETRITEIWEILKETKIIVKTYGAEEWGKVGSPEHGAAGIFPDALIKNNYLGAIKGAHFHSAEGKNPDYTWSATPILSIGEIAWKFSGRLFHVPKSIAPYLNNEKEVDEMMAPKAQKCLDGIWNDNGVLPEVEFDHRLGYGWEELDLIQIADISLLIKNKEGKPSLSIITNNSYRYGPDYHFSLGKSEFTLYTADSQKNDCVEFVRDAAGRFSILDAKEAPLDAIDSSLGWTDEAVTAQILMGDQVRFYPLITECVPVGVPLNPGSVGAALIANLESETRENRIDKLLIEQARITAEAGINFYEAMHDKSRAALMKISED